jgi:hypothetical protein
MFILLTDENSEMVNQANVADIIESMSKASKATETFVLTLPFGFWLMAHAVFVPFDSC